METYLRKGVYPKRIQNAKLKKEKRVEILCGKVQIEPSPVLDLSLER
jgi:hypothetical protein